MLNRRPPGNPTKHMKSFDMHEKLQIQRELLEQACEKEASVNHLMIEVRTGRGDILKLDKTVSDNIGRLLELTEVHRIIQSSLEAQMEKCALEVREHLRKLILYQRL